MNLLPHLLGETLCIQSAFAAVPETLFSCYQQVASSALITPAAAAAAAAVPEGSNASELAAANAAAVEFAAAAAAGVRPKAVRQKARGHTPLQVSV